MGVSKIIDYMQTKIKMPDPIQEHPAFSKAPNQDLKEMNFLCNFKTKIESQNLDKFYQRPVNISKSRY